MAYLLNATPIKAPRQMKVENDIQTVVQRTLNGSINRDFIGSKKRRFILDYQNINIDDFNTINAIYEAYLTSGATKTFQITETNYTLASINVHVDLISREFSVRGEGYLSNFSLVLTEA